MESTNRQKFNTAHLKPFGLFPSIGFFHQCIKAKYVPIISALDSQYYEIAGPNGVQILRFPVSKASKKLNPEYWEFSFQEKWVREHENALKTAYGKSPFFEYYEYRFIEILKREDPSYFNVKKKIIHTLLPLIGLDYLTLNDSTQANTEHLFKPNTKVRQQPYYQTFENKFGYREESFILDLLFNKGIDSVLYFSHLEDSM